MKIRNIAGRRYLVAERKEENEVIAIISDALAIVTEIDRPYVDDTVQGVMGDLAYVEFPTAEEYFPDLSSKDQRQEFINLPLRREDGKLCRMAGLFADLLKRGAPGEMLWKHLAAMVRVAKKSVPCTELNLADLREEVLG